MQAHLKSVWESRKYVSIKHNPATSVYMWMDSSVVKWQKKPNEYSWIETPMMSWHPRLDPWINQKNNLILTQTITGNKSARRGAKVDPLINVQPTHGRWKWPVREAQEDACWEGQRRISVCRSDPESQASSREILESVLQEQTAELWEKKKKYVQRKWLQDSAFVH